METTDEITVFGLIIISTLAIFLLMSFMVLMIFWYQKRVLTHKNETATREKEHQKKLLDASLEIADQERVKIAANIHDDVGMLLNVLKLNLRRIQRNPDKKEQIEEILGNSFGLIDNSLDIIRTISNDLMPPTLINLGFVKGMKELCRQINLTDTVDVNFISEQESIEMDKKTELQVYRLVKELLNNTLKHARPSAIEIIIENKEGKLIVSIFHNGMGITTESIKQLAETSTGLGLKSILTRTQLINARLEFKILENQTALVAIETPLL